MGISKEHRVILFRSCWTSVLREEKYSKDHPSNTQLSSLLNWGWNLSAGSRILWTRPTTSCSGSRCGGSEDDFSSMIRCEWRHSHSIPWLIGILIVAWSRLFVDSNIYHLISHILSDLWNSFVKCHRLRPVKPHIGCSSWMVTRTISISFDLKFESSSNNLSSNNL